MTQTRSRGQIILAGLLIAWGLFLLLATLLRIDAWALCWPALLIVAGALMLARPILASRGSAVDVQVLGDITRAGAWSPAGSELWLGVGDIRLDFSQAHLAPGDNPVRIYQLVGDVELTFPAAQAVALQVAGAVSEIKSERGNEESFFGTLRYNHAGSGAGPLLNLEVLGLVSEVKIRLV